MERWPVSRSDLRNRAEAKSNGASQAQFVGSPDIQITTAEFQIQSVLATGNEEDVREHAHEHPHFVLMLEGAYVSSAKGAPELATGSFLAFHPAWTEHRDRVFLGRGRFLGITLLSAGEVLSKRSSVLPPTYLSAAACVRIARLIELELRQPHPSRLELESEAFELVGTLDPSVAERLAPQWLKRAQDMITESAAEALTISNIASEAGVHPVYLARTFRKFLGCSPGGYLRARRLERAATLLRRPNHSITDIADMAGFFDQSHLTKLFGAAFGLTPAEYRRRALV